MSERVPASFRDPAGFVFRRQGVLYRQVNHAGRRNFDRLMDSGLYGALVAQQLLVPHEIAEVEPADPSLASLVIRPEPVPFIAHPYEWAPGQLRAAGEATLQIQKCAIEHGMTLRDASAYNVQFIHGRPTFIDTLSFGQLEEGAPWEAYGQYCRHFLAPLAIIKNVDVRLAGLLLRTQIDGIPLDLASRLLPPRTRLQFGLGVHIHAHAASQRGPNGQAESLPGREKKISRQALLGLVDSLLALTRKQRWRASRSTWRDYYSKRESYSDVSNSHKLDIVSGMLKRLDAASIWDLGANTGQYSRLAADVTDALVVAVEVDPSAVEVMWENCQSPGQGRVLPLLIDLANPSPSQGWAHEERQSLAARGPADVVMALALIHHLAIANNVPLPSVMSWFSNLARTVVIEWIPKDDPMVRRLLASREDVFNDYTTEHFENAALDAGFDIRATEPIAGSLRTVYLLERK